MKHKGNVRNILIDTVKKQKWLSIGILIAVLGAIGVSLDPAASYLENRWTVFGRTCGSVFVLCPLFCCACPDRFMDTRARVF